ncbi:cobyrinate a,c-diamide synthase [Pelagibius marinus]|uniref:cobyrinate a,c-diamide synthase n=1 Tax=Pelagibius marinus TaxID=2762760 RepID=UPI001872C97E|nr:cobyrinate a,c-diamide synthase [Pelagibius marinus]
MTPGLLVAAPASGSGKTTLTLALLRCLRNQGRAVASVKTGPDYIDPAFHQAASGRPCFNLDPWAMRPETLAAAVARAGEAAELVLGEGVMGLFDGAPVTDARGLAGGSTAQLAALTGWPVVLVIDCKGMGASVAALAAGFAGFHAAVPLAGVILNNVASPRHEALLRTACEAAGQIVFGAFARDAALARPSRHLGLVQAGEDGDLEDFLEAAAAAVAEQVDVAALCRAARPARIPGAEAADSASLVPPLAPLGQRIAVAQDLAFAFAYPLLLDAWRRAGAEVSCFSPLADEAPDPAADAVYLPGGYPELHAARLAGNGRFLAGLRAAAGRDAAVYGECGGYMVLGQGLEDAEGRRHAMAGLLPLESSFREPARHLGYRRVCLLANGPLGAGGAAFRAHEFHYARVLGEEGPPEKALFEAQAAEGGGDARVGQRQGSVFGSFLHLIDGEATS